MVFHLCPFDLHSRRRHLSPVLLFESKTLVLIHPHTGQSITFANAQKIDRVGQQ